ncbi:MAG: hypothetical protein ACC645_01600 [Pirellulales bacterium]
MSTNSSRVDFEKRAASYAAQRSLRLTGGRYGHGIHGIVLEAISQLRRGSSALKVFERMDAYVRERDVYLRLRQRGVRQVCGHHVPQLLDFDDELRVIEMTMVKPPFVLDFAGAWLDAPPDYSPEVLADWEAEKRRQFEDRWPEVAAILQSFHQYGIYISDVNPGNIRFRE